LIFKPFKRLLTKSDYPFSGLVIATEKKIVEKMSGAISVRSIVNEGSTFIILIPEQ
jgi:light-regulated signal transduction histidine kinase (bacteriophytochrome)